MEAEFNLDDFLSKLQGDRSPKRDDDGSSRITKLLMNTRDNQGTVSYIPFFDKKSGNAYVKVSGVREVKLTSTKLGDEVWHKILPREFYENMSEEDYKLYDEVLGYWTALDKSGAFNYEFIRYRTYALMYGILTGHTVGGNSVETNVDKPVLLVFPSAKIIDAIGDAINNKCIALKSKNWIPLIINNQNTGRRGIMSITFTKGSIGYDSSVGFEFNTEFANIVDSNKVYPDEVTGLFKDSVGDLLGWMRTTDDRYFNVEIFQDMLKQMKDIVIKLSKSQAPPVVTAAPEVNQNAVVDPMKAQAVVEVQAAPVEVVNAAPVAPPTAPSIDPVTGLPRPF